MKKILAFVMIFMLLCGSALATGTNYVSTFTASDPEKWVAESNNEETNIAKTELWLKVAATGQIDVTVPLVLVFQTNIEGGDAISAEGYTITNHSTADLVVTRLEVDVEGQDAAPFSEGSNPMALVEWDSISGQGTANVANVDQYAVQLSAGDANRVNRNGEASQIISEIDVHAINNPAENKLGVLHAASGTAIERDDEVGGLFLLPRKTSGGAETAVAVTAEMETGPLSFVTDGEKGVYLLTITYTVAIDTSGVIGETITSDQGSMKS